MFKNRKEAGKLLSQALEKYKKKKDVLVLAIPRGGVTVAYEVTNNLSLPLDVIVIKKIGHPSNEELAMGAAGMDSYIVNEDVAAGISEELIKEQAKIKQAEIKKRYHLLRGDKPMYKVKNKTIIIVDDGVATGATMLMAVKILKKEHPKKVVVAIPVAPPDTVTRLEKVADEVVCLSQPPSFMAIGQFYEDFSQVETAEAKRLLLEANA